MCQSHVKAFPVFNTMPFDLAYYIVIACYCYIVVKYLGAGTSDSCFLFRGFGIPLILLLTHTPLRRYIQYDLQPRQEQGLEALGNCEPEAEHRLLFEALPSDPTKEPAGGDQLLAGCWGETSWMGSWGEFWSGSVGGRLQTRGWLRALGSGYRFDRMAGCIHQLPVRWRMAKTAQRQVPTPPGRCPTPSVACPGDSHPTDPRAHAMPGARGRRGWRGRRSGR